MGVTEPTEFYTSSKRQVFPVMTNHETGAPTRLRTWRQFKTLTADNIYQFPIRRPSDIISEAFQIGGDAWGQEDINYRAIYFRAARSAPIDWRTVEGTDHDRIGRYLKMHLTHTEQIPEGSSTRVERANLKGRIIGELDVALSLFEKMLESRDPSVWGKVPEAITCSVPYPRTQKLLMELGFRKVAEARMGEEIADFKDQSVFLLPVDSVTVKGTRGEIGKIQAGIRKVLI